MADEIRRDANGYDYAQGITSRVNRHQDVLNESWPMRDAKGFHARGIDDQPIERQMGVLVRLVFENDGEDFLPATATRWTKTHVFVVVNDPRVQRGQVWVKAEDARRA